jgi:hypothetical protein
MPKGADVQVYRGARADMPALLIGEFFFQTDSREVHIGDGTNPIHVGGFTRLAKTGAYTVVAKDRATTIDATSGTWTLTLTAAATLGSGFCFKAYNSGSGVITIDANGAETIRSPAGSATTLTLAQGEGVTLMCDGTGWGVVDNANLASAGSLTGAIAFTGDISDIISAGTTNDYNPAGLSTASAIYIQCSTGNEIITGLAGGSDGRIITIHHLAVLGFLLVLKNESGSSAAANRFSMFGDLTLAEGESVILQYDAVNSRWHTLSGVHSLSVTAARLQANSVQTAKIADANVSNAKLANMAALTVKCRAANSSGVPADEAAAANDTVFRRTSDLLSFGTLTIGMFANDLITYAKIQNVAANKVLGSIAGGDPEEIACTAAGRTFIAAADAAAETALLSNFVTAGGSAAKGLVPSPGATAHPTQHWVLRDTVAFTLTPGEIIGYLPVATDENTTSVTYVDLTTKDEITFTLDAAGDVLVEYSALAYNNTNNGGCFSQIYLDTAAQASSIIAQTFATANVGAFQLIVHKLTGLSAGSHTIGIRHASDNAARTAHWLNRKLKISTI